MHHQAIEAWIEAARIMGFTFVSPFQLVDSTPEVRFDGFLPQFGSPKGMVVTITSDLKASFAEEQKAATQAGLFYSILNEAVYQIYDRSVFLEALRDWGWHSIESKIPDLIET
jgi:hypothetical protein